MYTFLTSPSKYGTNVRSKTVSSVTSIHNKLWTRPGKETLWIYCFFTSLLVDRKWTYGTETPWGGYDYSASHMDHYQEVAFRPTETYGFFFLPNDRGKARSTAVLWQGSYYIHIHFVCPVSSSSQCNASRCLLLLCMIRLEQLSFIMSSKHSSITVLTHIHKITSMN